MAADCGAKPRMRWTVGAATVATFTVASVWIWTHAHARASDVDLERAAVHPVSSAPAMYRNTAPPPRSALPPALAGTQAPHLPVDAHGHLARLRAVRDFFDYCLTAQNQLDAAAFDRLVRREIAAQLDGTPAQEEALDVWRRYRAYLDALSAAGADSASSGGMPDSAALEQELDRRASIAGRELGTWAEPFFAGDFARLHSDVARLSIAQDATLSDAQKQARLAALDQQLTPELRAQRDRQRQQDDVVARIAQSQRAGASRDEMQAQLAQSVGPEVAARVVELQQNDDAWRTTYAGYANERDVIRARGLLPQDQETALSALRQRTFSNPADARRAASLDVGAVESSQ